MTKLIHKIKVWFWWNFKASQMDKVERDMLYYGSCIMKNGKRINPNKFYRN